MSKAELIDARLNDVALNGANLSLTAPTDATLIGTDQRQANFDNTNLKRADLRQADLCKANLSVADVLDADLRQANRPKKAQ